MGWIEGFGNQALAVGALLAGVPLLIHIFNRQRHAPMPWAGMQFVMAAYKKTRRRSQLENLLLLLLRMAVVALLALALSRPFTSSDNPLAKLTEERRNLVLVLDSSASTGYRKDVETVYERIVTRAREMVSTLDGERGDRVRLITAAATPQLLSWRSPEDALSLLTTLTEPSDEGLDLYAALVEVRRFAEEDAAGAEDSAMEVCLLTDSQRRSFDQLKIEGTASATAESLDAERATSPVATHPLDRLVELGVEVLVLDLGSLQAMPANLGISSVRVVGTMLGPGMPTELGVTVQNHGPNLAASIRLALFVDGERQPSRLIEIPARGETEEVFSVVFPSTGYHVVEARLDGDSLAIDDSRSELIFVPPPIRTLIVNGDPKPEIDEDETGYLRAILEPLKGDGFQTEFAPFEPVVIGPEALGFDDLGLESYDVVFLANLESVPQRVVLKLESFVASGGSLIFSLGDRVIPEGYNARLWSSDGTGLLPAELLRRVEVRNRRESYFRAATIDGEHPALRFFADDRWRPLFCEVPIYAFVSSVPHDDARVLARLDDDGESPLLIERAYDRGRVYLWNTSIDKDWTRLPESPRSLIPFIHELLRDAGQSRAPKRSIAVGQNISIEVDHFPRNPKVYRPDGVGRNLDGDALDLGRGMWLLPELPQADKSGLWRIELENETLAYSVQFDALEGDLARLNANELADIHPALVPLVPTGDDGDTDGDHRNRSGELWRGFAKFCLAALILESLWASFIGRRRRWQS